MRLPYSALCLLLFLSACPKQPTATEVAQAEPITRWAEDERGRNLVEEPAEVDAPRVMLHSAVVLTAAGERYEPGWVLLDGGRIEALGPGEPPEDATARFIDLDGQFITPGLIDTHSHLGVYPSPGARAHGDGNEATAATTGGVWAEHSFWPQDPGIERAVAGGVTTIQVLPGSANLVGGRGVVLHMVPARGSRAMRFPGAPETVKMACGENPKRVYGDRGGPSTRMGNLRTYRQAFFAAQRYLEDWQRYEQAAAAGDDPDLRPPERDLDRETLAAIINGDVLPQVHCYRADDMLSIMQVADEMGWEVRSFHHALEAYKIRDILAERDIAVSTWADWWGFKLEAYDGIPTNAALVSQAGGRAVIHSDSAEGIQRLNQEASKAQAFGQQAGIEITEDEALRWITLNPAWALGIEDEVGTLEVGKRADVVVWDGHPFSVYTSARLVFVDGALRYDRDRPGEPWSDFELGQEVVR